MFADFEFDLRDSDGDQAGRLTPGRQQHQGDCERITPQLTENEMDYMEVYKRHGRALRRRKLRVDTFVKAVRQGSAKLADVPIDDRARVAALIAQD